MESKGEEDVSEFINDRLVQKNVSICEPMRKNDFDIWNIVPSQKDNVPFLPSKMILKKGYPLKRWNLHVQIVLI